MTPRPVVVFAPSSGVRGQASWYDYRFREAAAGAALRVGSWRGRLVTVCGSGCIAVRLTDYMANPDRIIDLDDESFARICGPLTRGVCNVVVTW